MLFLRLQTWSWIPLCLAAASCSNIVTPDYTLQDGHLAPCPPNRDCVSSQEQDPNLYIAPLHFDSDHDQAHNDLLSAITFVGQGRVVSNHRNYLRVEYPGTVTGTGNANYPYQPESAVDEVEFYLSPTGHSIEMRSLGKQGLLDTGANRERLEAIRAAFQKLQQQRHR